MSALPAPLSEQFQTLSGRKVRYLIGGSGKPLVLCHGFLSTGEEFGGRFADLCKSRLIIAPDLPGNGQSDPLGVPHTNASLAKTTLQLLDSLQVANFDVGGLCLGAAVATALLRAEPGRVDNIILHTPLISPHLVRKSYRAQIRISSLVWPEIVWCSRQRTLSNLYKRLLIEGNTADPETADINFANQLRADPRAAKEWLQDSLAVNDLDLLLTYPKPALVIVPAHDRLVNVEKLQTLLPPKPNLELFIDDLGRHGWSPAAVARHSEVMSAFLTQTSEPPPTAP